MKKKLMISAAALLLIGAGAIYVFGGGAIQFGTAEELEQTAASQAEEIEALRSQVEQLSDALAQSEDLATPSSAPDVNIVQVSSPATVESKPEATETKPTPVPAAPPAQVQNAGTVFEGYAVTVTDKETPAVRAAGTDWPITTYYFLSANGDRLGSITGAAMNGIIKRYEATLDANEEWEFWFADQFNSYRGLTKDNSNTISSEQEPPFISLPNTDFDAKSFASEAFVLVNEERVQNGLHEVEMESTMMERAEMRAKELEEKYDHVRPDGTRMSTTYKCAEIINRRADTAAIAVSSWMDSSGHKAIILAEKYNYAGIGSYQGEDGTVYWCMLFSK